MLRRVVHCVKQRGVLTTRWPGCLWHVPYAWKQERGMCSVTVPWLGLNRPVPILSPVQAAESKLWAAVPGTPVYINSCSRRWAFIPEVCVMLKLQFYKHHGKRLPAVTFRKRKSHVKPNSGASGHILAATGAGSELQLVRVMLPCVLTARKTCVQRRSV